MCAGDQAWFEADRTALVGGTHSKVTDVGVTRVSAAVELPMLMHCIISKGLYLHRH